MPQYPVSQSKDRAVRAGIVGHVPAGQDAALGIQKSCQVHAVHDLAAIIPHHHHIPGVVIRDPDIIGFNLVIQALDVWRTAVKTGLFTLTQIFHNRLRHFLFQLAPDHVSVPLYL